MKKKSEREEGTPNREETWKLKAKLSQEEQTKL